MLNEYQLLAKSVDYQLGNTIQASVLDEIQITCREPTSLVKQAEVHGVAPFLYQFFKHYNIELPDEIKRQLQSLTLRHKFAAQARRKALREIITVFNDRGIGLVLLKGAALAVMIYDKPAHRPMRDIDILISTADQQRAKDTLEELGFTFDKSHQSIYMGDIHHLPNAIKHVDGLKVSLELHHQVYSRDVQGSQTFEQIIANAQNIELDGKHALTLDHLSMLNHLCRHTFSLGGQVRLIHQYDIVKYAQTYINEIPWQNLYTEYPFIINTLRCLHYSIFLPEQVKVKINIPAAQNIQGIGQAMLPYTQIIRKHKSFKKRIKALFTPSPWWMHVNYNIEPGQSLLWCYIFTHPKRVIVDISNRLLQAFRFKLRRLI